MLPDGSRGRRSRRRCRDLRVGLGWVGGRRGEQRCGVSNPPYSMSKTVLEPARKIDAGKRFWSNSMVALGKQLGDVKKVPL